MSLRDHKITLTVDELLGFVIDQVTTPLYLEITNMRADIQSLSNHLAALTSAVSSETANSAALKVSNDTLTAANATQAEQLTAKDQQIAQLEAAAAVPAASGLTAEEQAVIDSANTVIPAAVQALSNSTTVNGLTN